MLTGRTYRVVLMACLLVTVMIATGSVRIARAQSDVRGQQVPPLTRERSRGDGPARPAPNVPHAGSPVGGQFVIADQTVDTIHSAVAYNSQDGEYLVVWYNDRPSAPDGIYAQRVSKDGALIGPWFAVAAGAGAERRYPDVAYNSQHNEYLVVWEEDDGKRVSWQRVSATGQLLGASNYLGPGPSYYYFLKPVVAYAATADKYLLVFVWEDTSWLPASYRLDADVYYTDGSSMYWQGNFALPSPGTANPIAHPDLVYNHRRNEFLVVWRENTGPPNLGEIRAQRVKMAAPAGPLGPVINITGSTAANESEPAVAVVPRTPDGQYMVAWQREYTATDRDLYARRVAGDGSLEGGTITVSDVIDDETNPAVAGNARNERYLIAWTHRYSGAPVTTGDIRGRTLNITGALDGDVRAISDLPVGSYSDHSSVASGPGGDFLVTFDASVTSGNRDVFGRLWGDRLFLPLVRR